MLIFGVQRREQLILHVQVLSPLHSPIRTPASPPLSALDWWNFRPPLDCLFQSILLQSLFFVTCVRLLCSALKSLKPSKCLLLSFSSALPPNILDNTRSSFHSTKLGVPTMMQMFACMQCIFEKWANEYASGGYKLTGVYGIPLTCFMLGTTCGPQKTLKIYSVQSCCEMT